MYLCLCVAASDFVPFIELRVRNFVEVVLFTTNDNVTLEYEDRVQLRYSASHFASVLEDAGEYIRDTATLNIIDNDRKFFHVQ